MLVSLHPGSIGDILLSTPAQRGPADIYRLPAARSHDSNPKTKAEKNQKCITLTIQIQLSSLEHRSLITPWDRDVGSASKLSWTRSTWRPVVGTAQSSPALGGCPRHSPAGRCNTSRPACHWCRVVGARKNRPESNLPMETIILSPTKMRIRAAKVMR